MPGQPAGCPAVRLPGQPIVLANLDRMAGCLASDLPTYCFAGGGLERKVLSRMVHGLGAQVSNVNGTPSQVPRTSPVACLRCGLFHGLAWPGLAEPGRAWSRLAAIPT